MLRISPRSHAVAASLVILAVIATAAWLLVTIGWFSPPKTTFGWQAVMTNVAGEGVRGRRDGHADRARFNDPFAVAMDAKGMIYVADGGDGGDGGRVRKIDPDGNVTTLPGTFDTPSGLALDRAGNIFVADTGANAIRKIAPDGLVTTIAGDGIAGYRDGRAAQARFNGPIGIAVDGDGNVYIADTYNDRIRIISSDGKVRTMAGGATGFADGQGASAAFDTPTGVALDSHGRLLVADSGNDAIRKVTSDGRVITLAKAADGDSAGLLQGVVGLTATWDGFVYVASYRRGRIVQLSPAGELRVLAGPGSEIEGNAALPLRGPAGIAVDAAGSLYVADASAHALRKLTPRGSDPALPRAIIPEPALPALTQASLVPWPVGPQLGWHEVVGDIGEVRGNYDGDSRDHLHAGLDISAPVGAAVLASADETVRDPQPNWGVETLSEGLRIDQITYIHMRVGRTASGEPLDPSRFQITHDVEGRVTRVRVKRGAHFKVGDPLGAVNRMAHVHLELGPPRGKINALFLKFPGFGDHVAPHIEDIYLLDGTGLRLTEKQNGRLVVPVKAGPFSIVADAWDQVDGNAPRRRLGLYRAGFQIIRADGIAAAGFAQPRLTFEFDRIPLGAIAAKIAFAPASGDTVHSDQRTRFLYVVTNTVRRGRTESGSWNPASLTPGDYKIRIYAADMAGNVALTNRDLQIAIR
jgi:streptogramin lyase